MFLRLEYSTVMILKELALREIDSCIDSARSHRLKASQREDCRESDLALLYETRASFLVDFIETLDSMARSGLR